jgi:hypothetical protein
MANFIAKLCNLKTLLISKIKKSTLRLPSIKCWGAFLSRLQRCGLAPPNGSIFLESKSIQIYGFSQPCFSGGILCIQYPLLLASEAKVVLQK